MNARRQNIKQIAAGCLLVLGVALFIFAVLSGRPSGQRMRDASRLERIVSRRLSKLDGYARKALDAAPSLWLEESIPADMVVYRYVEDSLQSWQNRFPSANDAIEQKVLYQRFINPRSGLSSPLSEVGDEYSFMNIGPKWYVVKYLENGPIKVVEGLEIMDGNSELAAMNLRLGMSAGCEARPLNDSDGIEVKVDGVPLFKLFNDSHIASHEANELLLWGALLLLTIAFLLFISAKPTLKRALPLLVLSLALMAAFFLWGKTMGNGPSIFSPTLYADGPVFYSLGGLLLLNLMVSMTVWCLFLVRQDISARKRPAWVMIIWSVVLFAAVLGIVWYSYEGLRSITLNSNINLEIYKIGRITVMSVLVYLSFIALLSCIPMLMQLMQPAISRLTGFHSSAFSLLNRICISALAAVYLVFVTSMTGFRKEQQSLEVWANRLALNRDIALEVQLHSVEDNISTDPVIASLSVLDNAAYNIRNRLTETYLNRVAQEYDMLVSVNDSDFSALRDGEQISPNSRFFYKENSNGLATYSGMFFFRLQNYGITRVMITIEQKGDWRYRGYASILGTSLPGKVLIPSNYSFARYQGTRLLNFKGSFAYPVRMDKRLEDSVYGEGDHHIKLGGHTHFLYKVADGESVIVSRPTIGTLNYGISAIFIALISFILLTLVSSDPRKRRPFEQNYFQTRLTRVIMYSLSLTLVTMAALSVYFVYTQNESNLRALMAEKINSIQTSVFARIRGANSSADLRVPEVMGLLEDVGNNTDSDVSLYSTDGMIMMSTAPAVFDQMLMDSRIDGTAYYNIMYLTSRYYIQKERTGRHRYYCMYAPLIGDNGRIIAIISSPYTGDNYDFETNAANHLIMILSVFLLLLLFARFTSSSVLERMFRPLLEMGRKMDGANLDSLEYIEYDKQDEISSLVNAYNRMVSDLSESSKRLAQAERDKAWSGMARQVAHEIKNPLTPMKLQLQRIIRLKAKGDPGWQQKFDEVAKVLLDHIDILTDTANEFSTFAKLYTEEPTPVDLDRILQEEISMFDSKGSTRFDYIGMSPAPAMAPKPQLTRVFVNLINNAVQALEDEEGGRVIVSLRNSVQDGYYDIVVEDNGPGVAPENIGKLFTPNFTTKTGGSGLGLAISRSILEKCGASISYSKSFTLGGACFTILYPKNA